MEQSSSSLLPFLFLISLTLAFAADAGSIGVNYGRVANDLPSAVKVVQLLKLQGLDRVKVFDTDPSVLRALAISGIKVTVDLPNQQLSSVARTQSFATAWVQRNVAAYYPHTQIEAIGVGNEVFVDTHNLTTFVDTQNQVSIRTQIDSGFVRTQIICVQSEPREDDD